MLQWGRVRLNAESAGASCGTRGNVFASMGPRSVERGKNSNFPIRFVVVLASMGPRSVERGKEQPTADQAQDLLASMGPRSVERGKEGVGAGGRTGGKASMGPRSVERGKLHPPGRLRVSLLELQWGRVRLNAERVFDFLRLRRFFVVLQWGRVRLNAERSPPARPAPSTAPGFNGAAFG